MNVVTHKAGMMCDHLVFLLIVQNAIQQGCFASPEEAT